MNACLRVFPHAHLLLCWWHVLKAWRQHFSTDHYPELWELLQRWLRTTDTRDFDHIWTNIQAIAPVSMVEYLASNWLAEVKLWSAVYRTGCMIFMKVDTNMLLEAWHHVLKGKFLENKRNRRLDHLLYTLIEEVIPYYRLLQRRRQLGFDGPDLEVQQWIRIQSLAELIPDNDIEVCTANDWK